MSKKSSKYIPIKRKNPIAFQNALDKLELEVSLHGKNIDAISKSHDVHITMLSNFARHDIKNSVQSMDSILTTNTLEEINQEHLNSLKLNIGIIRETIDNFSKLVPYSKDDKFEITNLFNAIELINRETFYVNKIKFTKEIPNIVFTFNLPFQSVLQMLNNIIINAVKAFEGIELERKIKINVTFDEHLLFIKIFDNASKITFENINIIFDYGVSTTGGSGIGLFHAKYLCNLYKGKIELHELNNSNDFNKYFLITLPLLKE